MDIKAYIETGVLESYALGMCNEAEAREVETLCLQHPELRKELESIQESLNAYSAAHAVKPTASVKDAIFSEIARLEKAPQKRAQVIPPPAAADPKIFLLFNRYRKATAIAASLFIVSLAGNIYTYNKYKAANEQVIALNQEKQVLADNMKANQVKFDEMHRDMAILSNPDVNKVMMRGIPAKSPDGLAMIYWNKASKEVYLEVKKLPMPDPGKQYQLWAIVDGKPVDAGMITMAEGDSSLHRMKDFETAQAFAITLEKEGGNPSPTLTEMYVMGAVSL